MLRSARRNGQERESQGDLFAVDGNVGNPVTIPRDDDPPWTAANLTVFDVATFRLWIDNELDELEAPRALDLDHILHHRLPLRYRTGTPHEILLSRLPFRIPHPFEYFLRKVVARCGAKLLVGHHT